MKLKKRYIALILVLVVLVLAAVYLARGISWYSAQVIAKEAGSPTLFAPFPDRLDFGEVAQGGSEIRTISLENSGGASVYVKVFILGSIGGLVKIEPNSFSLKQGESQDIRLTLGMPASATLEKKFSGRVIILRFPKRPW
jgi:hypothetical protein